MSSFFETTFSAWPIDSRSASFELEMGTGIGAAPQVCGTCWGLGKVCGDGFCFRLSSEADLSGSGFMGGT